MVLLEEMFSPRRACDMCMIRKYALGSWTRPFITYDEDMLCTTACFVMSAVVVVVDPSMARA